MGPDDICRCMHARRFHTGEGCSCRGTRLRFHHSGTPQEIKCRCKGFRDRAELDGTVIARTKK